MSTAKSRTSSPDETAERILAFLRRCSTELTAQAADSAIAEVPNPSAAEISEGAAALAAALERSVAVEFEPSWLPCLDTVDAVDDSDLAQAFVDVAPLLQWVPTFRSADEGQDFALAPMATARDLGDLNVGLMYVRPGAQYPLHNHPPQELYLTLSGQAQWRFGGNTDFQPLGPASTLYNHPNDLHSAIAGETPLVALYVLWP